MIPTFGRYFVQHRKWQRAYAGTVIPEADTVILDAQVGKDEFGRKTVQVHRLSTHLRQGTQFSPMREKSE